MLGHLDIDQLRRVGALVLAALASAVVIGWAMLLLARLLPLAAAAVAGMWLAYRAGKRQAVRPATPVVGVDSAPGVAGVTQLRQQDGDGDVPPVARAAGVTITEPCPARTRAAVGQLLADPRSGVRPLWGDRT